MNGIQVAAGIGAWLLVAVVAVLLSGCGPIDDYDPTGEKSRTAPSDVVVVDEFCRDGRVHTVFPAFAGEGHRVMMSPLDACVDGEIVRLESPAAEDWDTGADPAYREQAAGVTASGS